MTHSKLCPQCGIVQTYSTKYDLAKAVKAQKLCRSCAVTKSLSDLHYVKPVVDLNSPRFVCFGCACEFNPPGHKPNAKYCSAYCRQNNSWKLGLEARGDVQRDRGEGKTYRKLNGRHEHRVVVEEWLGRPLTSDEIVHHKDGNKRNNDLSNLEVMSRSAHSRHHSLKNTTCSLVNCSNKHAAKGLCRKHYDKMRKTNVS